MESWRVGERKGGSAKGKRPRWVRLIKIVSMAGELAWQVVSNVVEERRWTRGSVTGWVWVWERERERIRERERSGDPGMGWAADVPSRGTDKDVN